VEIVEQSSLSEIPQPEQPLIEPGARGEVTLGEFTIPCRLEAVEGRSLRLALAKAPPARGGRRGAARVALWQNDRRIEVTAPGWDWVLAPRPSLLVHEVAGIADDCRRAGERPALRLSAVLRLDGAASLSGHTVNLSSEGALVRFPHGLPARTVELTGREVEVWIEQLPLRVRVIRQHTMRSARRSHSDLAFRVVADHPPTAENWRRLLCRVIAA
jgi:hypothetical protein